jgi:hypothetical protein
MHYTGTRCLLEKRSCTPREEEQCAPSLITRAPCLLAGGFANLLYFPTTPLVLAPSRVVLGEGQSVQRSPPRSGSEEEEDRGACSLFAVLDRAHGVWHWLFECTPSGGPSPPTQSDP